MADGLFDNRYRYDYIYPRGRSGETLRALDTANGNRAVVIKRPAPNDAPPIRAGQEVSILNERKALQRLAGHPVLAEFVADGQFFVGGMPHQYIVMERAQGVILADLVLELSARGERLPMLEMLVITDRLLDLLHTAHQKDIVYNDVDAKHLFWDRATYTLKVIDWGNAVFLEGDEVTPQGISRQSDVYQAAELLYFLLTGGSRMESVRDAGDDFALSFGVDAERILPRLQAIVSRAAHPNPRLRYRTITELRRDLAEVRQPLERERDAVLNRTIERMRRSLSKTDLRALLETVEQTLALDPGHPATHQVRDDITNRLRDLEVSADLDAVRIYLEGGNWTRAADLLNELRDKAGSQTAGTVGLLLDCTLLLLDSGLSQVPPIIIDAVSLILDGQPAQAAEVLLLDASQQDDAPDGVPNVQNAQKEARKLNWLLAERISSHIPDVLLLRPNLYRLDVALAMLAAEGISLGVARSQMSEINVLLNDLPGAATANLAQLRDGYRAVVDRLTALNNLLLPISTRHNLTNRKLPLSALDRALNAAMALADNMHVIGKQSASSPRDALAALDSSRAIDALNGGLWDVIGRMLDSLYKLLQTCQVYIPAADGSDVEVWLATARTDLLPFVERLFDEMLVGMVDGLKIASAAWTQYSGAVVQGNRMAAVTALAKATEAVGTISPTLAGWLNQLRVVVDGASIIERHAIFGGLGRALADGWEAYDRGRLADAERLGQQALDIARSEAERFAAKRLLMLASTTRDWIDRSGAISAARTQTVHKAIESLYTPDEIQVRDHFAAQMPSRETYLRAMGKGLIDLYQRSSTPALRLVFFTDVLLGVLEAHDARLEDALFWRDVAVRLLGDLGARHPATRALEEFVERRREINRAAAALNQVNGQHAIATLEATRRQIEENPQARLLAAAAHSLREFEGVLRDWAEGEFRGAGTKLDSMLNLVSETEQAADITLTQYRAWLVELQATAAELLTVSRQMRQLIERRPAEPSDVIRTAHRRMAETTTRMLGEAHAAQLRQWHETYEAFLAVYTDTSIRRSARLNRFSELFRAMFIDRHPAYPLYRHWVDLTESAPEFPAPPTSDPTPRLTESIPREESFAFAGSKYAEASSPASGGRRLPIFALAAALVALGAVIALVIFIVTSAGDDLSGLPTDPGGGALAVTAALTNSITGGSASQAATAEQGNPAQADTPGANASTLSPQDLVTPTLVTRTATPTHTPLPPTATFTAAPPTATPTPTLSPTPSITPSPTNTPTPTLTLTPTLPPDGLRGPQDLLALPARMTVLPWSLETFSLDSSGTFWRFGLGEESPEEELFISFSPQTLNLFYGNNAPSRIRTAEATLSLSTYNPALLQTDDVYFGMMLQSAEDPARTAGLFVQVESPTAVNLWQRASEERVFINQRSVSAVVARVRLERDTASGAVTVFFNDLQVGDPIPLVGADSPVIPVLFVQEGGVIISVSNWRVTLR